jgi:hypothetical protein
MKSDKYRELKKALATWQAERAKTAKWIEEEYRPKFEASTLPDKIFLDGVAFRAEYYDAQDAFRGACTAEIISALLEEKGLSDDPDYWVSYASVLVAFQELQWCCLDIPPEVMEYANRILVMWGDK